MKLLLDENLSDRILPQILDLYPGSAHVKPLALLEADDGDIWNFARENNFTLVSKDSDFHQRGLLFGHPPKFIFLRIGNCPTSLVTELLRDNHQTIAAFIFDPVADILILP